MTGGFNTALNSAMERLKDPLNIEKGEFLSCMDDLKEYFDLDGE